MAEMPSAGLNVTLAVVSSRSGACPAPARPLASAIEKQLACAAAISSSGLVPKARDSARWFHVRASWGNAPLAGRTVPLPLTRLPSHVALALLSTLMLDSFHGHGRLRFTLGPRV